jgi:hypothetical protein
MRAFEAGTTVPGKTATASVVAGFTRVTAISNCATCESEMTTSFAHAIDPPPASESERTPARAD